MKKTKKKIVIISVAAGALLVLAGAGIAVWKLNPGFVNSIFGFQESTTEDTQPAEISDENVDGVRGADLEAVDQAGEIQAEGGSTEEVAAVFDQAVQQSDGDEEKGVIKLQELDSFTASQEWTAALAAGLEAELFLQESKFLPQATSNIAYIYEVLEDTANAQLYYQKTLDLILEENSLGYDIAYYREKAGQ
ncbi:MAG TPA: hypothetical protein QF549_02110 [Candidatus Saccharimonadaceae bacterium]|nr:hypothetical protein [Candidatus Saccharimonadaceae bacterium]